MGYDSAEVKRYYESNTPWFLRLGQGVDGTIRRAVWGPGVSHRRDAMAYVDELILEQLQSMAGSLGRPPRILDLGCGVGASLCRMAKRCSIIATGVTISPTQARLAVDKVEGLGLADSVSIMEADYTHLPDELHDVDLAFAIESFVHAPDASRFFSSVASVLRPGGVLIVCDDFAVRDRSEWGSGERRSIERYCVGWRVSSLLGPSELERVAGQAGFALRGARDLTPFVELGRARDYAIALVTRSLRWLPVRSSYWSMLEGGDALQRCLKRGWVSYRFLVWEAPGSA